MDSSDQSHCPSHPADLRSASGSSCSESVGQQQEPGASDSCCPPEGPSELCDLGMNVLCAGSKLSTSAEDLSTAARAKTKRRSRTLTFRRKKSETPLESRSKRSKFSTLKKKFPVRLKKARDHGLPDQPPPVDTNKCVCTGYRRTEDHVLGPGVVFAAGVHAVDQGSPLQSATIRSARQAFGAGPGPTGHGGHTRSRLMMQLVPAPPRNPVPSLVDLSTLKSDEFPTEDIDELLIAQRARDMEFGIELSPTRTEDQQLQTQCSGSISSCSTSSSGSSGVSDQLWNLGACLQTQCVITTTTFPTPLEGTSAMAMGLTTSTTSIHAADSSSQYGDPTQYGAMAAATTQMAPYVPRTYTQVDYMHCLVPDLWQITNCCFYWGVMDRYEAERLLENRPEGTFLLRDSAQEEFLFSVSFRRYGRSLHARIEQWNHKFSFDSHDPGVFASDTVCGLIEHYKDPTCCMFFEPMLTIPLNRSFPFSLQHLCRAVVCGYTSYDDMNLLPLPKSLNEYLKYYHYKQKIRVRRIEVRH